MHAIIAGLGWFAGLLVMVFGIVNLLVGHILPTLVLVILALLLLPPTRAFLHHTLGRSLPWWVTTLAVIVLSVTYLVTLVWSILSAPDVFKTAEVKTAMMAIYDEKLADWPVPYETRMVETSYGQVHVIISGEVANPPMLLFHASAMSAWSWRDNIAALSQDYRTYAIDTLGEANRSVLTDTSTYPTQRRGHHRPVC